MKRYVLALLCAGMVGTFQLAPAPAAVAQREAQKKQPPQGDKPLEKKEAAPKATAAMLEGLLRPEPIITFADQIGLTPDQQQAMRAEVQQSRRRLAEVQTQLRNDTEALNAELTKEPIDKAAAMERLDRVLEDERTIKRANLELAISLRSKLTAEQVAKLEELQKAGAPGEKRAGDANAQPVAAIRKAMQEVQEQARKKQEAGGDISEVKTLVESVKPLVQKGRYDEALAALEKAKALLKEPAP